MRPTDWYLSQFDFLKLLIDSWCSLNILRSWFQMPSGIRDLNWQVRICAKFRFASVSKWWPFIVFIIFPLIIRHSIIRHQNNRYPPVELTHDQFWVMINYCHFCKSDLNFKYSKTQVSVTGICLNLIFFEQSLDWPVVR